MINFEKNVPSFIRKRDQKQVQDIELNNFCGIYEITEKIDGLLCIIFKDEGKVQIYTDDEKNSFMDKMAEKYEETFQDLPENYVILGKIIGPEIDENYYGLKNFKFYLFDVFDTEEGSYLSSDDRHEWLNDFNIGHLEKILHIPVFGEVEIEENSDNTYNLNFYGCGEKYDKLLLNLHEAEIKKEFLKYAERESALNMNVESAGFVLKNVDNSQFSFIVESNKYLIRNEHNQEKKISPFMNM